MNIIQRNKDIVLGNNDLELLYSFKNFPVFMGCTDQDTSLDLVSDLNIYISKSSGMLQVNPVLPLDIVYQSDHSAGTTGGSWLNHHRSFAAFLSKFNLKNVFEIGGATGILSKLYNEIVPEVNWTILEPNPTPIPDLQAKVQQGYFDSSTVYPVGIDSVVHSHVYEHIYDPLEFAKKLHELPNDAMVCFSVPDAKDHLYNKFTHILHFEHTYLCTPEFVEWCMTSCGFDLVEKECYDKGHSIFYAFKRVSRGIELQEFKNVYSEIKDLFDSYIRHHLDLIEEINKQIDKSEKKVYLFGAHIFSQFLLSFGLNRSRIECLLDNNKSKQGKRLYGTDLVVADPKILSNDESPIVILRCGVFNNEIKNDILKNINPTTQFLE
jgi:hypothetical protein